VLIYLQTSEEMVQGARSGPHESPPELQGRRRAFFRKAQGVVHEERADARLHETAHGHPEHAHRPLDHLGPVALAVLPVGEPGSGEAANDRQFGHKLDRQPHIRRRQQICLFTTSDDFFGLSATCPTIPGTGH